MAIARSPRLWAWILILAGLCVSNVFSQRHSVQKPRTGVVTTFDERALFGDDGRSRRDYPSPDGRYVVCLEHAKEGGYVNLLVLARQRTAETRRRKQDSPKRIIVQEDVTSFAWVPKRAHTLVVATSDMYGWAGIRYWDGKAGLKALAGRRGSFNGPYHGQLRTYVLTRVDKDGRNVSYECWDVDCSHLLYRRTLRLP